MMSRRQLSLIAAGIALVAVLLVGVPLVTPSFAPAWGFVLVLAAYWALFCIPVSLIFIAPTDRSRLFSLRVERRELWLLGLLGVQIAGVFFGALWPHLGALSATAIGLGVVVGLLNGTLEELAWRGAYLSTFRDKPLLGFAAGWVLFTLWHIPLSMTAGMVFEGGPLMLIGSSAGLGLLWSAVAFRTGSLAYVVPAHILTNAMAFSVLFASNGIA
jgi:membrane protease YdiL (CAAX protease family)